MKQSPRPCLCPGTRTPEARECQRGPLQGHVDSASGEKLPSERQFAQWLSARALGQACVHQLLVIGAMRMGPIGMVPCASIPLFVRIRVL